MLPSRQRASAFMLYPSMGNERILLGKKSAHCITLRRPTRVRQCISLIIVSNAYTACAGDSQVRFSHLPPRPYVTTDFTCSHGAISPAPPEPTRLEYIQGCRCLLLIRSSVPQIITTHWRELSTMPRISVA